MTRLRWISSTICALGLLAMVALFWQPPGYSQAPPARASAAQPGPAKAAKAAPVDFNIPPVTDVSDPYPTWNGVTVDPQNGLVFFSDLNRRGYFIYDRLAHSEGGEVTKPLKHVSGNKAGMGFVAGIQADPEKRLIYIAENDGPELRTFSYDDDGNVPNRSILATPHQIWGVALNRQRGELAVGVEELHAVLVYRQGADKLERPLRIIRGENTGLADPHGIFMDSVNNEILTVNHGNWRKYFPNTDHDIPPMVIPTSTGRFELPSIRFHPILANGDVKPARTIQGDKTTLDWPMQLDVDLTHNEIAIANFGQDSIVIFDRRAQGNVAPIRVIKGEHTGINGPVGVAIDAKNDELFVANYGDHTAVVFPRTASGDVAPKRIIRNAPQNAETCGFTNASSATYDTKRQQILVAN
jgi:hypothetical protein